MSEIYLKSYILGELVELSQGLAINAKTKYMLADKGLPLLRITDLINETQIKFVNPALAPPKCIADENDIIYTRTGQVGLVYKGRKGVIHNNCFKVIPNERLIDSDYLFWFLSQNKVKKYANDVSAGSVQKDLNHSAFKSIAIDLPPIEYQKTVGPILTSLSEKIELNRQTNQTLENIAQAIFKSWFVDFEPTRAKVIAQEKGGDEKAQSLAAQAVICGAMTLEQLSELSTDFPKMEDTLHSLIMQRFRNTPSSGLDKWTPESISKLADQFPNALVDSELGEIPEGWEVKPLSKMVKLIGGGTPKRSEANYWGGNIPWFSVKDAPAKGGVFVIDTEEKITELGLNKSSTKLLAEGVTIVSARGTVGKLALVGVPTAMNQSCYGVQGVNSIGPCLNYFNVKKAVVTLQQNTHGAVFDTITKDTFDTVSLIDASKELKRSFEELVNPFLQGIKSNLLETNSLSEVRNTLLPRLLSGELSVSEQTEHST